MSIFVAESNPPTPFAYKCDPLTPVAFQQQLKSIADIQRGQHLLIKKRNPQHLLVKSCNPDKNKFTAFKEEKGRIVETTIAFPPHKTPVFEIFYEEELCPVESADAAVQRAEDAMLKAEFKDANAQQNEASSQRHSSHFVTEMKTGRPLTVEESCLLSADVEPISLTPITSHVALDEGDHIVIEFEENQFRHGIVLRIMGPDQVLTVPNLSGDTNLSGDPTIPYLRGDPTIPNLDGDPTIPNLDGDPTIPNLSGDSAIPNLSGDSAIPNLSGDSAIPNLSGDPAISNLSGDPTILNLSGDPTIPNLSGDPTIPIDFISSGPRVFRVNYKQSVPADQVKKRACSEQGKCILSEKGPECFATWAQTGKPMAVNMLHLKTKKPQLRHIRPLYRERVTSPDDIRVGDHLVQGYPSHWFHFLVAEKFPNDPSRVRGIYCLRTKVAECDITLDLLKEDVYRIQYPESFAPEEAIARATSQVGERKCALHARMWFVRWAKTGSDEGLEVDLLENHSLPLTKSRIRSFAQLNVGDAIVKKETLFPTRYYLVTKEVSSPFECEAIESFFGIRRTTVKFNPQGCVCYRVNYYPGACFLPRDSVKMASNLVEIYTHTHQFFSNPTRCSRFTSQCFINYVKTGDPSPVDSDTLKDDRPLGIRTVKVTSTGELLPGDHIKRPTGKPLPQGLFHHMMVAEKPEDDGACSVFHFNKEKSIIPTLSRTMDDIFQNGNEVYRICYPERIDPNISLPFMEQASKYVQHRSIPENPIKTEDDIEVQALLQEFVIQNKVCLLLTFSGTVKPGTGVIALHG